jgi:hypothetical protein
MDKDNAAKLIAIAYYMGRESATREVSDKYNALIQGQRERAAACRYHRFATAIIGDRDYIYSCDYSGDMTAAFGPDATNLSIEGLNQ